MIVTGSLGSSRLVETASFEKDGMNAKEIQAEFDYVFTHEQGKIYNFTVSKINNPSTYVSYNVTTTPWRDLDDEIKGNISKSLTVVYDTKNKKLEPCVRRKDLLNFTNVFLVSKQSYNCGSDEDISLSVLYFFSSRSTNDLIRLDLMSTFTRRTISENSNGTEISFSNLRYIKLKIDN